MLLLRELRELEELLETRAAMAQAPEVPGPLPEAQISRVPPLPRGPTIPEQPLVGLKLIL